MLRDADARLERPEVPVVDAKERDLERQRPLQLGLVVNLHEDIEIPTRSFREQFAELHVGQTSDDREDRVGTVRSRLNYLIGACQEVFPQDRKVRVLPSDVEIAQLA